MREEDKVLLLAEILGVDTSKYIEKYIEELRSSTVFLSLCQNVRIARNIGSYKAQILIDEFESIDFSNIKSLKDYFILLSKINYLFYTSLESDYINPFFYNAEIDSIETVGEIVVDFDSRRCSLNDMILDERYTTIYKIDYLKNCYLDWRKEVVEKFINPLNSILVNKDKLPKVKVFDLPFTLIMITICLSDIIFVLAPLVPSSFIRGLYLQNSENIAVQVVFNLAFIFLFINNLIVIVITYFRYKSKREYIKALRILDNPRKIIKRVNHQCEKFYQYILNGLTENRLLNHKIKNYCLNKKDIVSINTLMKIGNNKNQINSKNVIHFILRLCFVVFCTICVVLMVYLLFLAWRKFA